MNRKASDHQYYVANRERIILRTQRYYSTHKEKTLEYKHRWYRKNRKRRLAQQKAYAKTHKTRLSIYSRAYHKKHHYNAVARHNYQARKKQALGVLTVEITQRVYEDNIKQFGTLTCYLCLKKIEFGKDCIEHKNPLARGGTNLYENLAIAHRSCNNQKCAKTVSEYLMDKSGVFDD